MVTNFLLSSISHAQRLLGAINTYLMHSVWATSPFYRPVYVFYGKGDLCLDF